MDWKARHPPTVGCVFAGRTSPTVFNRHESNCMKPDARNPSTRDSVPNTVRGSGVETQRFAAAEPRRDAASPTAKAGSARLKSFTIFALILGALFFKPLFDLVRYSLNSELHSHMVLIPFISGYLVWLRRKEVLPAPSASPALAVIPLAVGLLALCALFIGDRPAASLLPNDYLALASVSFLCFFWSGALLILGGKLLRALAFPAAFLIFITPLPTTVENAVEVFFQYTSAEAAALLFAVSGSTVFREGLVFQLPGITLQVAQECSGIRSSLVLFITSLLAGQLFLQSPWRRCFLTAFVIPLAIVRNGFRVFTLGWLCVHVSPNMIDSPIHHRGGPLFFLLSLIPFFLILLWLRRRERHGALPGGPAADVQSPGNQT